MIGILRGNLPRTALNLSLQWASLHQAELLVAWESAQARRPFGKNPPSRLAMIPMPNRITAVESRCGHLLHLHFRDGAEFELDLLPLLRREADSCLTDPLLSPEEFQKVKLDYGTLAFPTGYDICPDVLRLWCERGGSLSQEETDACFRDALRTVEAA